ncbi:uncharacterized protein LOC111642839 [Copidosoma floridanum]|uniref:uncharacterized protein LOC111642839 n=1 Tax=Copidosoma floridanum TaxID=29053 RepID=UPI000C6FB7E4|nr:uncharacterized protein LOC111642839 [Copidosoma floridanum]
MVTEDQVQQLEADLAAARAEVARLQATPGNADGQNSNSSDARVAALYRQPKIPNFCRDNPQTWFLQAEITLRNAGIRNSVTKADFIAEKLDLEALQVIQEIMTRDPAPADIFELVKNKLIATFGSSAEERLRKLIKGQVHSDGKPSLILNALRALNVRCDVEILKTIFLEQLPAKCKAALSLSEVVDLDRLAALADKFVEASGAELQVSAVASQASFEKLEAQIAWLASEIKSLKTRQGRSRSRGQSRPVAKSVSVGSSEKAAFGKLNGPRCVGAVGEELPSRRLHIRDGGSGLVFLIDTGAEVSLVPRDSSWSLKPTDLKLFAANNTPIQTFGEVQLLVDLRLKSPFSWKFCVAAVPYPIIGADLLNHFGLLVDIRKRRLIDPNNNMSSCGFVKQVASFSVGVTSSDEVAKLLSAFPEVTGHKPAKKIGSPDVFHHIVTNGPPISERVRRLTPEKYKAVKLEFEQLVREGYCRHSSSPWASPLHLTKKRDGSWRVCGDFRRLNSVTEPDHYPLPHLHDYAIALHGKCIFSTLDLHKAYHQIPVAPEDVPKTAVITPFGLFEYLGTPFGLRNACQSFQRYINRALSGLDFVFVYLDDILIFSSSAQEHFGHLRVVLERLERFGLQLNLGKCKLVKDEVNFLGYVINSDGSKPSVDSVQAVLNFPKPRTVVQLRRFLGMVNTYRRGIPHAAKTQAPLNDYIRGSVKNDKREIAWTPEADAAFEKAKEDLAGVALLSHPAIGAETRLVTDASDLAMGAVVEQRQGERWRPLGFFSRKFTPAQTRYSTYDRELTAVYEATKYFRYFLEAMEFYILTDHKPLIHAFKQRADKALPRQCRQLSFVSQFTTSIQHIAGIENSVADALSRVDLIRLPVEFNLLELAQLQKADPELAGLLEGAEKHSLVIKSIEWGQDHHKVFCDVSGSVLHPYVPQLLRRRVFELFHSPAHPGAKVTDNIIRQSCEGYSYILTMIDRFSRWPEAVPLKDISAITVARAFFDNWIARFGTPCTLTTDQGPQFESQVFKALLNLLGVRRIRTAAYHPAANGMIERWHRDLKKALMCHNNKNWLGQLSTVMLGLRTAVRLDSKASPADFLYGTSLRVPGEFCLPDDFRPDPQFFLEEFRVHMRNVKPVPVAHRYKPRAFFFKDLRTCTHVFLKAPPAKKVLERPYSGPHEIIERISDQDYKIVVNGSPRTVSTELLKPAHFIPEDLQPPPLPETFALPKQAPEVRHILKTLLQLLGGVADGNLTVLRKNTS